MSRDGRGSDWTISDLLVVAVGAGLGLALGYFAAERVGRVNSQRVHSAEASLYASIIAGQLEVADLGIADWQRIQDLVSTYADLRLGGTDASVVALAERHGAVRIATLNWRHFAVVRPRHAEAFELLP